jgi:hypothetical protein
MPADRSLSIGPGRRQARSVDGISRRVLIGGAATAIVVCAAGVEPVREAVGDGAGGFAPETADPELPAVFQANARRFHAAALAIQDRFPRQATNFLAIAIELSLKSYLLHRGFNDGWNRVHIGHDLGKALRCAQRAGFQDVPPELPSVAARLGPYYVRHAFDGLSAATIAALHAANACDTVQALQDRIDAAIGQARLISRPAVAPPEFG